jgi:hypothetical protein
MPWLASRRPWCPALVLGAGCVVVGRVCACVSVGWGLAVWMHTPTGLLTCPPPPTLSDLCRSVNHALASLSAQRGREERTMSAVGFIRTVRKEHQMYGSALGALSCLSHAEGPCTSDACRLQGALCTRMQVRGACSNMVWVGGVMVVVVGGGCW